MEFSKSAVNAQKRLDKNIGETFKEYKARMLKEEQEKENARTNNLIEQADLVNAKRNRERERLNEANKRINYENLSTVIGLTEALTEVVKHSLLLDLEEYSKINENYEDFIRSNIRSFLENADLNLNIDNPNTLQLIETMNKMRPALENGIYLTEAELKAQFNNKDIDENSQTDEFGRPSWNDANAAIDGLSCNVMDRVAEIIDNDTHAAQIVDDNLNAIVNPMSESTLLVRNERPRKTVLEVLALNEANEMLANNKGYNSDLALANAITYITILETLDASGLVSVGRDGYNAILEAAGERNQERRVAKHSHAINLLEKHEADEIKEKVSLVESKISARHANFKSFSEWKKEQNIITENTPNI